MNQTPAKLDHVAPSPHGKALPVEVNEYLRQQVEAWIAADPKRTAAELARLLDVKPATMSNVRNHGRGVGARFESGMARVLGVTVDELRRRAAEAWKAQHRETVAVREDRYPNRAAAVAFLRGEVSPEAIDRVQGIHLQSDEDPSRSWWVERLLLVERSLHLDQIDPAAARARGVREATRGDELADSTRPRRPGSGR